MQAPICLKETSLYTNDIQFHVLKRLPGVQTGVADAPSSIALRPIMRFTIHPNLGREVEELLH